MSQDQYLRIAIVSPNKSQKHQFINTLFSDTFYSTSIIKRQKYVLVLRKNKKVPISNLHRVTPVTKSDKFIGWKEKSQNLAQSPLIPKYLDYFTKNICDYTTDQQSVFLVQTSKQALETQYYVLQFYDIPSVKSESDVGCVLIDDSEQPVQLIVDMIIVVLSKKDCFKENTEIISGYVGNNKIAKVWVVVGEGVEVDDIPLVGENHKIVIESSMERAIEGVGKIIGQVEQKCLEELSKMVCKIPTASLQEQQSFVPEERQTTKMLKSQETIESLPTSPSTTTTTGSALPAKPALFQTPADLANLSTQQIQELHILLTRDISRLPLQQYNSYLKQIGYNRFVSLPELSFRNQLIGLAVVIVLSLVLRWLWLTGLSCVVGLIAIVSKAINHNKVKRQVFDQAVKRNQIVLFGREGIVTDKIAELDLEIKRRKA